MKHNKRLLIPAVLLALLLFLTSCSFVTYHRHTDAEAAKALEEKRAEAIEQIEALSDPDYYTEENRKLYEILLQDAINELNECRTLDALEEVLFRHAALIMDIPTSLVLVRQDILNELEAHTSLDAYREAEQEVLKQLLAYYKGEIEAAEDAETMHTLFRHFQADVYALKTDAMYLAEEFEEHKKALADELLGLHNPVLYREAEQKEIDSLINRFAKEAEELTDTEELELLYHSVVQMLDALRTDASYYEEEKELLVADSLAHITETADKYSTDAGDLEALETSLQALPTKEEVTKTASEYLFGLIEDAEGALAELKRLAKTIIENTLIKNNYWSDDCLTIDLAVSKASSQIQTCQNNSEIKDVISATTEILSAIPTSEERWKTSEDRLAADLTHHFGDLTLSAPKSLTEAQSYEELAAIIDYYAFYQIDYTSFVRDTFRVKLNYPHKSAQWEINEVYWYSELIRSAVGITGYFEKDGDTLVIELIPYAIATESNAKEPVKVDRYTSLVTFDSDKAGYTKRADDFDDFAYLRYEKTLTGIWNTQQLWYALEHEYVPIPVAGSPADKALERAKEILREVVCDGMSIEEKAFAIYSWYAKNVTYDEDYRKYLYPQDREHFPDELAATLNAFHAEGALFDNLSVCCSFAKSYLILLRIEGIESYRMFVREYTENAIDNLGKVGYGSHAFVVIRGSDGLYYYSDPEEAYNTTKDSFLIKHNQFFTTDDTRWPYENGKTDMYKDLIFAQGLPLLYSQKLVYAGHPIAVHSEEALEEMLNAFDAEDGTNIQFSVIESEETLFSVKEHLINDARFEYKTFTFGGVTEYMIYQ